MALALNKIHGLGKSCANGSTMGRRSRQRAIFDETDLFRVRRNNQGQLGQSDIQGQLSRVEPHPNSITDNLEMASGHGRIFVAGDDGDVIGVRNEMDGKVKREPE